MTTTDSEAPVVYVPQEAPARAEAVAWILAFLLAVVAGYLAGLRFRGAAGGAGRGCFRVEVTSDPEGASLYVNGELKGCTPLALESLPAGRHAFRLEKAGRAPAARVQEVPCDGPLSFSLAPAPTGAIRVAAKTPGVEVILDGEAVGFAPLTLKDVSPGSHQVVLRKTNFDAASIPVTVKAGETAEIGGVELRDRILAMLEGVVRAEPYRISHLLDLGHYHFLNGRLDEAVECYVKANRLAGQPLEFPPEMNLSEEDKAAEARLRTLDVRKLRSEIAKHMNANLWGRNAQRFREKIEAALPGQSWR